jgi:hypothetical protein
MFTSSPGQLRRTMSPPTPPRRVREDRRADRSAGVVAVGDLLASKAIDVKAAVTTEPAHGSAAARFAALQGHRHRASRPRRPCCRRTARTLGTYRSSVGRARCAGHCRVVGYQGVRTLRPRSARSPCRRRPARLGHPPDGSPTVRLAARSRRGEMAGVLLGSASPPARRSSCDDNRRAKRTRLRRPRQPPGLAAPRDR